MEIEYRTIARFPGYRFGSDGSVWSCWTRGRKAFIGDDWKQLVPSINRKGYFTAHLLGAKGRTHAISPLVCEAFHGPKPEGMECCHHPDRNPLNNRADNLRWGTSKENKAHREADGMTARGERNGRSVLTEVHVREILSLARDGIRPNDIAELYGVNRTTIYLIKTRRTWKHIT